MHTRKRALAGVTAGALALGVLAFSPVAPASAAPDPGQPGSTMAYLAGSMSGVPIPTVTGSGGDVAAVITTNETVGVFARHRIPRVPAVPGQSDTTYSPVASDTTFAPPPSFNPINFDSTGPYWKDVTSAGATVARDTAIAALNVLNPLSKLGTTLFVSSSAAKNTTTTVTFFRDQNDNGLLDTAELPSAQLPITLRFVPPADVVVLTLTEPAGTTQAFTTPAFYSVPVVDLVNPLLQDVDGPISWPPDGIGSSPEAPTRASGLPDYSSGSFASLNGDQAVAATNQYPPLYNPPALKIRTGLIDADATGVIKVTGWFDPTGATPFNATAAPITPPAGFKATVGTLQVVSQVLDPASTMTASGAGVVLDGPVYSAPLSTTSVTFELTALRNNIMNNEPLPFVNTPVKIKLNISGTGGETFTVGTKAVINGSVVSATTDANGKATVTVNINAGVAASVTDELTITAELDEINGLDAPAFEAPGDPLCDYVPAWACVTVPRVPVEATVIWNVPGRMSYYQSSGSVAGIPFFLYEGGLRVYASVLSGSTASMTVNLVDTFGNVIPGRHVTAYDAYCGPVYDPDTVAPADHTEGGGTTNANGSVTFGVVGQINGFRNVCVEEDDEGRLLAWGVILYKPAAQLAAGGIDAQQRSRALITEGDDYPFWAPVTFRVKDSTGDPMAGVAGTVTTSLGVLSRQGGDAALDGLTGSTLPVIIGPNGRATVWVASATVGSARVTLSIGGKSKSARVDFSNRGLNAETLSIGPAGGGAVPSSVKPFKEIRMMVSATDANGNPLEGAYVLIKVKGNARLASGGRQKVVYTGQNGMATFKVKSGKSGGSFEVIAKTDAYVPESSFTEWVWWGEGPFMAGGPYTGPYFDSPYYFPGKIVKARTGVIDIE